VPAVVEGRAVLEERNPKALADGAVSTSCGLKLVDGPPSRDGGILAATTVLVERVVLAGTLELEIGALAAAGTSVVVGSLAVFVGSTAADDLVVAFVRGAWRAPLPCAVGISARDLVPEGGKVAVRGWAALDGSICTLTLSRSDRRPFCCWEQHPRWPA